MKNYPSKIDHKILERLLPRNILDFSEDNYKSIGELYHIIISNPAFVNNIGANEQMVSLLYIY